MLRALVRKELRQLLPWAILLLGLEAAGHGVSLLYSPPDELAWAPDLVIMSEQGSFRGVWFAVFALLFSYAGFPREHEEGTLDYLFSLPVSKTTVFLAKTLAAGSVLSAEVLLSSVLHAVAHLPNPTTFVRDSFRWDWQLCSTALCLAVAWMWVGYALLLSVFRRFGLLFALLAYVTIERTTEARPDLRWLDPFELLELEFVGDRPRVPWAALSGHLVAALVSGFLSALFWVGPTERIVEAFARWTKKPVLKWATGVLLAVTLGFFLVDAYDEPVVDEGGFGRPVELRSKEARIASARYEFRFPEALRVRVEPLAASADDLYDRLAKRVGTEPGQGRVVVDLTRSSRSHAGTATWDTIRMDLGAASDDETLKRIFAHESTHVLALRATDRRLSAHAESLHFFDEGLAEWLSLQHVPSTAYGEARRLEAALLRSRKKVRLAELVSYGEFVKRYGQPAVYGLGLTWVETLIEKCGKETPRRLLGVLARPDLPTHLSGEALWQHLLQVIGCDLVTVQAAWEAHLGRAIERAAAELAKIPTLAGGAPRRADDGIALQAELEGEPIPNAAYAVNVRSSNIDDVYSFSAKSTSQGRLDFWIPEGFETNDVIEFQLAASWMRDGELVQSAEDWQKTKLRGDD